MKGVAFPRKLRANLDPWDSNRHLPQVLKEWDVMGGWTWAQGTFLF